MKQVFLFIAAFTISIVAIGEDNVSPKSVVLPVQVITKEAPTVVAAKIEAMPEMAPMIKEETPKLPMPPAWLETVMNVAMKVPFIGPVLLQVMQWLGLIASVMTILVTALLAGIQSLNVILKWVKLGDWAVKIIALQNSPIFYWLKFFSIYNAKKTEVAGTTPQTKPKA